MLLEQNELYMISPYLSAWLLGEPGKSKCAVWFLQTTLSSKASFRYPASQDGTKVRQVRHSPQKQNLWGTKKLNNEDNTLM